MRQHFRQERLEELFFNKLKNSVAVGRDGQRRSQYEAVLNSEIEIIQRRVQSQNYKFVGYKQKLISKGPDSPPRQIAIATQRDRLTLKALSGVISEIYGSEAKNHLPHVYIKDIKSALTAIPNDYVFLRIDVKKFYDSIFA
jgi:RNA-directed DNA polymerase